MTEKTELAIRLFRDAKAWEAWLEKNHVKAPGIVMRFAKKGASVKSVSFQEALDVALCYGWIDGQGKSEGDETYLQRFTPRRKRSTWSKRNRARALELIEEGRMRPAGLAEVERAKEDGRWDAAYDSPSQATVPPDLEAALKRNKKAKEFFGTLNATNRYAILHRIQTAKKPETRERRIKRFVEMLERGEKIYE